MIIHTVDSQEPKFDIQCDFEQKGGCSFRTLSIGERRLNIECLGTKLPDVIDCETLTKVYLLSPRTSNEKNSGFNIFSNMVPRPDLRASDQIVLKPPTDRTLRFREDGTFHIGVFEDLHFAEGMSS